MLLFRQIRRIGHLVYGLKKVKHAAKKCLYKEQTFDVNPRPYITIYSDIFVKVSAIDMIDIPAMNKMQAQLYGTNCKQPTANLTVKVEGKDKNNVEVICKKLDENSDWHLELEVPITSSVNILAGGSACVQNVLGSEIRITANNNIHTMHLSSKLVELISAEGNIKCSGVFAPNKSVVQTGGCGNIHIKKLMGIDVECKTKQGNILVESSYGLRTKFTTQTGKIDLRNFHKKVQVFIHKTGDLIITAFNGVIHTTSYGGRIILDLIQVKEENVINANPVEKALVFISDTVEHTANMKVTGSFIELKPELEHLGKGLNEDKTVFELSSVLNKQTKFVFNAKAAEINLGKISWLESMYLAYSMGKK